MLTPVISTAAKQLSVYDKFTADPKRVAAVAALIASVVAVVILISYKEFYWSMVPLGTFCLASAYLIWDLGKEGGLTMNLRAAPSVFLIAVCVTGVFMALIYKQVYLTIPFLVGMLAAAFTLAQAVEMENLKKLSGEIDRLHEVRLGIQSEVGNFRNENVTLKESNTELRSQLSAMQAQIADLEATKAKLGDIAHKLNADRKQDIGKLRALHEAIARGGADVLKQFGGGMNLFAELLEGFETANNELTAVSSRVDQKANESISEFRALAGSMRTLADGIEAHIKANGQIAQTLPAFLDLQKEYNRINTEMAATQAKLALLTPLVERLDSLEARQQANLRLVSDQLTTATSHATNLGATASRFETLRGDLAAIVRQANTEQLTEAQQIRAQVDAINQGPKAGDQRAVRRPQLVVTGR